MVRFLLPSLVLLCILASCNAFVRICKTPLRCNTQETCGSKTEQRRMSAYRSVGASMHVASQYSRSRNERRRTSLLSLQSELSDLESGLGLVSSSIGGTLGIIICDHGSRRAEANSMLQEVADRFIFAASEKGDSVPIVTTAHMELAEPSIEQAFDRCVSAGATSIICHPFFLSPGRHVTSDIPALLEAAAAKHVGVKWMVSEPLGLARLMPELMHDTIKAAVTSENKWREASTVAVDHKH